MGLSGRKKSILGLDIGSHAIKSVLLNSTKSGLVLKSLGVANLTPDAILEGNVQDEEVVVSTIKNLLKAQKNNVKAVCTSISGYSVIIKKINLPTTTREELSETIEVEAEQYIPFDISEVNVDFEILGQSETTEDQIEVVLVAAKKDIIDSYMELLVNAGLAPTIVDVDVFAMENAFSVNYPDVKGTVALIDIGANKLNINVLRDGVSLFTRDAPMGGARITVEIQEQFDVDYETAEGIKLGAVEAPDQEVVSGIVSRAIENWAAEIKRAFEFLEATYPEDSLSAIYLSGGSSRFEGLDRYLGQETDVPIKFFNPFTNIGIDQRKFDPAYIEYIAPQVTICLGLALRLGEEF
ncbi:MAG: type IV pilus assembly protein PilM [Deltaproteobacteria bacterium]|nr:type IV pilus assembly protein PilM [Deltaproteobacteria bacterium]